MNVLTFAGTLNTGSGLEGVEHNHQEIKDGMLFTCFVDGYPLISIEL